MRQRRFTLRPRLRRVAKLEEHLFQPQGEEISTLADLASHAYAFAAHGPGRPDSDRCLPTSINIIRLAATKYETAAPTRERSFHTLVGQVVAKLVEDHEANHGANEVVVAGLRHSVCMAMPRQWEVPLAQVEALKVDGVEVLTEPMRQ